MTPSWAQGLVSIVVPTFNSARWIAETLDSLRNQKIDNYEVVIADNGSVDDTLSVVRHAVPDARVVHATIRGPAAARNAGLEAARGEFLQFLDSDDLLAPGKILAQRQVMEASGADVVWGTWARLYADDSGAFTRETRFRPRITTDASCSLLWASGFVPLGAVLIRRSRKTEGVRFDESFRVVEDIRYLQALSLHGATFRECPDPPVAFWLREHDAPHRASAIAVPQFWAACADNAETIYRAWIDRGERVGHDRVEALTSVWLDAAEKLAVYNDPRVGHVLELLGRVDSTYWRRLRLPHRAVAPLLGYRRTIALVEAVKAVRSRILHGATT